VDEKKEILNALKASREWNNPSNTPLWRRAFAAYNAATGNKLTDYQCSRCVQKVVEWLTN